MKKRYQIFYILLFVLISNLGFAQLTIVNALAVDGDSNGFYGTVEIEFSTGVNDAEMQTSALPRDDWEFSEDPEFTTFIRPNSFSTEVFDIAVANVANDKYIRLTFPSEFSSSTGTIYYRYINGNLGSDDVTDFTTGTDVLADFAIKSATDGAPPVISGVVSNATDAGVLKVGESIVFTVDFEDTTNDPNLTILPAQYNSEDLNWITSNGGDTYTGTYTVTEGNADQTTELQLTGVTATDEYGNVSASFNGTDVDKTIDANTPTISSVTSDATAADTLIVGETITFTVDTETGLTILPLQYNGQNLNWTAISGGDTYQGIYTVMEGDQDRITPLQLTGVTAEDAAGNISNTEDGSDVVKSIDANTPSIVTVKSDATAAGILKVGDKITFTIDVATPDGNLSVNPSNYNGETLSWSTSDGGDSYIGIYTVVDNGVDQTSDLQLTGVTLTDAAGNVSSSVDGVDIEKTIDSNIPTISSVTSDATAADTLIVGETITFTVDVVDTETGLTILPLQYNGQNLNWTDISSGDTYQGIYTVMEGDQDRITPLQLTGVTAEDAAGNISNTEDGSDVVKLIDANTPSIVTVKSDATEAGILKVGDKITFTIDVATPDGNLSVNPSNYNGETLSWSTSDGGDSYIGIYTVVDNGVDQTSDLQLTGVTLTDAAGNVSSSFDGVDIVKTIDSNIPTISSVTSDATAADTLIVGETITFTVDVEDTETGLTILPLQYNGQNLNWTEVSSGDTYRGIYTVMEGDQDKITPLQLTGVTAEDAAGNISNTEDGSDVVKSIDANTPSIVTVTSDATLLGVLKVGDKITFTIDVVTSDGNLTVNPTSYNGRALNWFTDDGGSTYTGIYNVTEGDPDQSSALPFTGVTLTDVAGNVSAIYSASDVVKTIDANSPFINNFVVPQINMTIGNTYTATISVSSDPDTYTLTSGELSGFTLHSLTKDADDSYSVDFTITDLGYDILSDNSYLISNLVMSDASGNISNTYSSSISQINDPIYTISPSAKVSGNYDICDKDSATLLFQLTGNSPWDIELDTGVGITTISSINASPYIYKVQANDLNNLVDPDTAIYKITQVTDVNGIIVSVGSPIDSATVFAYKLPVVDITYPAGDQTYNISASEDTLVGNPLNGIFTGAGIVSSNNTFHPSSAGLGEHNIEYTYTDPTSGCSNLDSVELTVIESAAEIVFQNNDTWWCDYETSFTLTGAVVGKPSIVGTFSLDKDGGAISSTADNAAIIDISLLVSGGSYIVSYSYFDGVPITFIKSFTIESVNTDIGIPVINDMCEDYDTVFVNAYNLAPLGGSGTFTFSGSSSDYFINDPNNNKLYFYPDSIAPGDYNLKYYYTTPNGCNSVETSRDFKVNALPIVDIVMDNLYNIEGGVEIISGTPNTPAGIFSPSFMIDNSNGTANFNPSIVGLGIDTAYYTYTDVNGCVNQDTAIFEVDKAKGQFYGLDKFDSKNQYCYFNSLSDTISVIPLNGSGFPGSFYIDNILFTNNVGNDSIAFSPSDIISGNHDLRFTYTRDGVEFNLDTVFNIDSIGSLSVVGLDSEYCQDDDRSINLTGISDGAGSGLSIFGGDGITDVNGIFKPADANIGTNTISYTFTRDDSGCQKSVSVNSLINKVPDIGFILEKTCISSIQDSVLFTSDTLSSDNVINWNWSVTALGNSRLSNEINPKFSLTKQEKNFISLTVETDKACSSSLDSSIFIGSVVDIDFSWDKECFGETVTFKVLEKTDELGVDSVRWNFGGDGFSDLTDIYNPQYTYDVHGGYDVTYEEFTKSCGLISETLKINIRPSISLSSGAYFEDFEEESDVTGWAVDILESTSNSSWEWGVPNGTLINTAADGTSAFVTNLDGNYANDEKSIISSPCFDLSGLERPMISFDFISDLQEDRDGVVIEYAVDKENWKILGFADQGVDWFNTNTNYDAILGSSRAWTGDGEGESFSSEDVEWRKAKYWLEDVVGEAGVRFRFTLGTDDAGVNEGFGFDNLRIGDRNRMVLLEHFANPSEEDFINTQNIINNIVSDNPLDVISVQFFTSFPEINDLSSFYTAGPSARSLYYGVSQVPYSIVDGGDRKFNYSSTNTLGTVDIQKRMLEESKFEINVKQDNQNDKLVVSGSIKAKENISGIGISARIAIVEKTIRYEENTIHNVLRAMLPDPAGKLIEREWLANDSVMVYQSWDLPELVNKDSLMAILFIQDELTNEIYQAGFTDKFSIVTSNESDFIQNENTYSIYPNPMSDYFTIVFGVEQKEDLVIDLYNNIGVLVKTMKLEQGLSMIEVNTDDLPIGIYYVQVKYPNYISSQKIVKSN
ncbi:MAG: T9SS type A sorting domain-containing protein [Bacteroidales bacterium]|nr:T9SS type A sorting domain-containing protein [Bacteroidales bacterium]